MISKCKKIKYKNVRNTRMNSTNLKQSSDTENRLPVYKYPQHFCCSEVTDWSERDCTQLLRASFFDSSFRNDSLNS